MGVKHLVPVGGIVGGLCLISIGLLPFKVDEFPVPPTVSDVAATPEFIPAALNKGVKVHNTDTGLDPGAWDDPKLASPISIMTTLEMGEGSVFIPELGIYSLFDARSDFVDSSYKNFDSLSLPKNPHRSVWFSGGVPPSSGVPEGTTLIASHISYGSHKGAFTNLYKATPGTVIYTRSYGATRPWVVTSTWTSPHQDFPEDLFTTQGTRRLVLVTCGGRLNDYGTYTDNVFVSAVPL